MDRLELDKLKSIFGEVKTDLQSLKKQSDELSAAIESGNLVPKEASERLKEALELYQEHITTLHHIGAEMAIGIHDSLEDTDAEIMSAEQKLRISAERGLILDYFRMTAVAEDVKDVLEASKKLLQEKCRMVEHGNADPLKPFFLVVNKVADEQSELSEDEYDEIERSLGRPLTRAVDRKRISIDSNLPIAQYLDGSCSLLAPDEVCPPKAEEACDQDDNSIAEQETCATKIEIEEPKAASLGSSTESDDNAPADSKPEPLWSTFDGYADNIEVTFEDVSAQQLGASKFTSMARQKPMIPFAIFALAHHIFLEESDVPNEDENYFVPSEDIRAYLKKQGFLAELTLSAAGETRTFLTLTSKGWACFTKKDVVKFMSGQKPSLMIPAQARLSTADLTPENALRLTLLHDYFSKRAPKENYTVMPYMQSRFPFATGLTEELNTTRVVAAVFVRGNELEDIDALQKLINEQETEDSLHIVVMSKADISALTEKLDLTAVSDNGVLFCLHNDPSTLLDHTGNPAVLDGAVDSESEIDDVFFEDLDEEDVSASEKTEESEERQAAQQNLEEPEITHLRENSKEKQDSILHYRQEGWRLLRRDKNPDALALFKALSRYTPEDAALYQKLAYALDDPSTEKKYKYTELLQVFDERPGEIGYDALALSAYLRLFFSNDIRTEHYHIRDCVHALDGNAVYNEIPQLKDAVFELSDMMTTLDRGFDRATLNALMDRREQENQIEQYRSRAKSFLEGRFDETSIANRRVAGTRRHLFGNESLLRKMLEIVVNENGASSHTVAKELRQFLDGDYIPGENYSTKDLSERAVEQFVDAAWEAMAGEAKRKQNDSLKGMGRTGIISKVKDVVSVCLTWASLSESSKTSDLGRDEAKVRQYQSKVGKMLQAASQKLSTYNVDSEEADAYLCALKSTVNELRDRLDGRFDFDRDRFYFVSFLNGNTVEVGEDYCPNMEEPFDETSPFSLCKRILEHSRAENEPWSSVLKRIFEDPDAGRDYGHASLIKDYLAEREADFVWPANYDIASNLASSEASLNAKDSEFLARLEMADNYGWVEDSKTIDRITADMEKRRQHCMETRNYGFYFRTMGAYLARLERDAEAHQPPYKARLDSLRAKAGAEYPVFREISRMIDEHMYTVAQDYMDQVEKEGLRDIPESVTLASVDDALTSFISNYSDYYKMARDSEHGKLPDAYKRRHKNVENNLVKTGRSMLEAWPRSLGGGAATSDKLRVLFLNMGLPVKSIEQKTSEHYYMTFAEQETSADYPHPIGAYGSEMLARGIHVFLLFGGKDAVTMNSSIRKVLTASVVGAAIILTDTQISLSDRRKLAQTIKQENQNRNPYLIIDRVMILHLADQPQSERWNVFLKCALPFHYLNPFTESSTVEICPDMFIGRRQELEQVISPGGANIIYGGRQLGKTALMHHARKLEDNRSNGKWSIFLDIRTDSSSRVAQRIYEKLQDEGFLKHDSRTIDWDELTRAITNRIQRGTPRVERFLLLLDEADNFLVDCQNSDYAPVVALKRIQIDTENRFKFVLAGLHNVLRFYGNAADGNSALPHLASITIKPLPFKEASELLERPLSYLGFKLKRENVSLIAQILSSTNYFPGLIQFYASRLVRSICQTNYGDASEKPPYWLREDQILTLLKDPEFLDNIKSKFMITLGIDQTEKGYYKTLAYVLAYCYFKYPEDTAMGYSAEQLKEICKSFDIHSINELSLDQVRVLLEEMKELNVLRKNDASGQVTYFFNRTSFRHMLGDEEDVEEKLMEIMEKEQQNYAE